MLQFESLRKVRLNTTKGYLTCEETDVVFAWNWLARPQLLLPGHQIKINLSFLPYIQVRPIRIIKQKFLEKTKILPRNYNENNIYAFIGSSAYIYT